MKLKLPFVLLNGLLIALIFTGCKKNTSEFTDELKLGSGMSGIELTGESSTFTLIDASIFLYFRLESKDDMAGRTVVLDFLTSGDDLINTITREQAQSYGHIMLSSFEWWGGTGNFKINAYLADGTAKIFIATTDFTIN
jgi:hypothetical protein